MAARRTGESPAANGKAAPATGKPSPERVLGFYTALWDAYRGVAAGALEQALARERADVRLDALGVRVLLTLLAGEQRITDLGESLVAALPNVSRVVRALEDQGLVERALSATRRGAVNIRPTPRGLALARDLWTRMFEEISGHVAGWTEEELAEGERLLLKLRPAPSTGGRSGRSRMPARCTTADEGDGR